jgi:drug/metabolite transporter (DMT)-like permease
MTAARPASTRTDWLAFLALGFFWGSSYLFIKIGVETLTPLTLVMLRLLFGTILLGVVVAVAREPLPRDPRILGHLFVMAILSIVIPFFLITWGEQTVDSSLASIINSAVPLPTIILAAVFLHDEPITLNRVIGLVVGFGGVVLLTSRGLSGSGGQIAGEIALVLSTISYGMGAVYARRNVRGLRPMTAAVCQVGLALLITTMLALVFEDPFARIASIDGRALFAVVWLGLVGSGLAYLAFFRTLARWGATRTSMVAYLLPIWGIVLGVVVLSEQIDAQVLLGTVLIIGGVALVNAKFGGRRLFGRGTPAGTA